MSKSARERAPCSEQHAGWDGWRSFPCRNKASVERDGKPWCGIHDPVAREERRKARGPSKFERELEAAHLKRERVSKLESDLAAARAEAAEATKKWAKADEARIEWRTQIEACKAHLKGEELERATPNWNGYLAGVSVAVGNVLGALREDAAELRDALERSEALVAALRARLERADKLADAAEQAHRVMDVRPEWQALVDAVCAYRSDA